MATKVVSLTGGIGSGKSVVATLFAEHQVAVIDTDAISHRLTGPDGEAMGLLATAFGAEFVSPDGSLNRDMMRRRVFADPLARSRLEGILHPMIMVHSLRELHQVLGLYAILVVPILFECNWRLPLPGRSLVVDCSEALQIERALQRGHLDDAQVHAIMAAQLPRIERNALADDIIENNGTLADLRLQVAEKYRYYNKIFK